MIWLAPVPPVVPMVVQHPFAPAAHNWLPAHRGVDLAVDRGQWVRAPRPGRIVFSARIADRPVLVLRSGGVRFSFEPVRGRVEVGSRVRRGQRIGRVGRGGHCAESCLHWGARVAGDYVDPLSFLPRRSPVLKPVSRTRSVAEGPEGRAATCCGSG